MNKTPVELANEPPQPEAGSYLLGSLYEIGPMVQGGMSARPLEFPDVDAWARTTHIPLEGWEARAIVTLSRVYSNNYNKASEGNPLPRREPLSDEERQSVTDKLRFMLDGRVSSKKGKSSKKDK